MLDLPTALHEWLAIPLEEQPADYYRLIGVNCFEADMNIVIGAAEQRLRFLSQFDAPEQIAVASEIRELIEAARNHLLSPSAKQSYDNQLRGEPQPEAQEDAAPAAFPSVVPVTQIEGRDASQPQSLAVPASEATAPLASKAAAASTSAASWLIGRHRMCDVIVNSPYVSTRHCELLRTGEGYYLRDLESTNRTFVNGQLVAPGQLVRVNSHDVITLGKLTAMPWPPHLAK